MPNGAPRLPPPPQLPIPEGVPAPFQELGHAGQRTLSQAHRSANGILQGGNPVVEAISGIQSALQNIPLPVEFIAQARRGMRNARFPFAEMVPDSPPMIPGEAPTPDKLLSKLGFGGRGSRGSLGQEPGTPTGARENPDEIPVF